MATEEWAIVEINGHRTHLGRVQATTVAGVALTEVQEQDQKHTPWKDERP